MPVTVRRATPADAHALAAVRWAADDSGHAVTDRDTFVARFEAWFATHPSTHLPFLAEVDGEPVGLAWLMVAERVPSPSRPERWFGDVQSVYVVPERRNGGVGAALMEAVLAEAGRLGLEHVTVHSARRAVAFYRRAGFASGDTWLSWRGMRDGRG